MWIRPILLSLLWFPAVALADDFKIIKLEQDVRNLERQVGELQRQVNSLERRGSPAEAPLPLRDKGAGTDAPAAADTVLWYSSANWDRVRVGMDELDVIRLLGKPTTMRGGDAQTRTLLYAVEIGSSGFLGGSVELQNHRVVAVNKPVLK